jgi:hypothetical protein
MRFATLIVAGIAVSVAVAHPPEKGKGKHDDATAAASTSESEGKGKRDKGACHPKVSFILKGDYVTGTFSATGEGSFAMLVKKANKHGREYVGKQVTIEVGVSTKVRRRGKASVSSLAAGDRLVVHVRGCKAKKGEAAASTDAKLYAKKVDAKGPKAEDGGSTTTTGTTTTSTTDTTTTTTTTTTSP